MNELRQALNIQDWQRQSIDVNCNLAFVSQGVGQTIPQSVYSDFFISLASSLATGSFGATCWRSREKTIVFLLLGDSAPRYGLAKEMPIRV